MFTLFAVLCACSTSSTYADPHAAIPIHADVAMSPEIAVVGGDGFTYASDPPWVLQETASVIPDEEPRETLAPEVPAPAAAHVAAPKAGAADTSAAAARAVASSMGASVAE